MDLEEGLVSQTNMAAPYGRGLEGVLEGHHTVHLPRELVFGLRYNLSWRAWAIGPDRPDLELKSLELETFGQLLSG